MADALQRTAYFGRSLRRREDRKLLTGKGRYVDDINCLARCIWRSCARRTRTPRSPALTCRRKAATGVCFALTGGDLIGGIGSIKPNWVIPGFTQ